MGSDGAVTDCDSSPRLLLSNDNSPTKKRHKLKAIYMYSIYVYLSMYTRTAATAARPLNNPSA